MTVRPAESREFPVLARLFFTTVRSAAGRFYSTRQRRAWARRAPGIGAFRRRLEEQAVLVAVRNGRIAGFMTLRPDGYLDMAFVAPRFARRGIGGLLLGAVRQSARDQGLRRLYADASFPARAFFLRHGWTVVRPRKVRRRGSVLINFRMETELP